MSAVTIKKLNDAYGYVVSEDVEILKELYDSLTFFVPGYRFMPSYKNGWFDGRVRLMNLNDRTFPLGLTQHIYDYCESKGIKCSLHPDVVQSFVDKEVNEGDVELFFEQMKFFSKKERIYPRDDQLEATIRAIKMKRCLNVCPTSFGKSISITMECLWYIHRGMRCLIIVPTKDLVDQFYNDILDYATNESGKLESWYPTTQRIYSGMSKELEDNTDVCISTWQSLSKIEDDEYLNQFDVIINDECFDGDAKVLTPTGYKKIKELQIGDKVINYNEVLGTFKEDEIVKIHKNLTSSLSEKMYELTFDNKKTIKVTGNHKFLTQRGWVRADELTEDDDIVEYNSSAENIYNRSKAFYNSIFEEYNQNLRILSCNKNVIELNNGIILNNKKDIQLFRKRLQRDNIEWKNRVDEWIVDENVAIEIKHKQSIISGMIGYQKVKDKLRECNIGRQPWNKGMKNQYHPKPMSEEGRRNLSLSKMGEKNAMYGKHHSSEHRLKQSNKMKELIKNGEFTPNTNNIRTHFDVEYNGKKYRSSWEVLFHYNNPSNEYEKLRIPYILNDIEHIYIVDFIDNINKTVTEIKPLSLLQKDNSQAKIMALKEWCEIHNYKLCILCENEIKELRDKTDLSFFNEDIRKKLEKL